MIPGRHPILLTISQKLVSEFPEATIRGEGAASFVFVQKGNRSVEISMLDEQRIWVEFWDQAQGDDSSPVREQTYDAWEMVLDAASRWLTG